MHTSQKGLNGSDHESPFVIMLDFTELYPEPN